MEGGFLDHTPAWRTYHYTGKKKEKVIAGEATAQQLIAVLEEGNLKYETYFKLIIATGMRRGECCGLQWGDINWDEPSRRPAPHDALHLRLAVQADLKEARPAPCPERPLPAAHQRQPPDRGRGRRSHSGGTAGRHSQPSTTLDIYTHAFNKNKKAASQVLQEGLEI